MTRIIAIYIRVSTLEQVNEGYSIAAQRERLTDYCKAQGWDDYKFYIDEGVSAKDTDRTELKRLFEDMRKGKIKTILVYRLDRFTRRVIDLHKMLEEMEKYNCSFKSATEIYDTTNAMGRMFITIVAAIAQWEAENLSERIKMALNEKVSSGERVGNVPYGFDLDENEKLVKNDKSFVVKEIINMYLNGKSAKGIAEYLTEMNDDKTSWKANTVIRILTNPALYGATRWNDKVFENTHEGIITKEEFEKVQIIHKDRSRFRKRDVESRYLFSGKIECQNCSRPLSANRLIRKNRYKEEVHYASYRCNHCWENEKISVSVGEKGLLEGLYEFMKTVEIPKVEVEEEPKINIYEEQLLKVEKKREKYQKAWASDLMTDDEFKKLMDETRTVYEELKIKSSSVEEGPKKIDPEELTKIKLMFNNNFKLLTPQEKKEFVSQFFRKIEFERVPQPPKEPHKSKAGRDKIVIKNVVFM